MNIYDGSNSFRLTNNLDLKHDVRAKAIITRVSPHTQNLTQEHNKQSSNNPLHPRKLATSGEYCYETRSRETNQGLSHLRSVKKDEKYGNNSG
jgi:hypothetical protein